ncbi:MAG: ABC transporter ATP-binding protein [Anaerolineae bacterium]|nr:ABC transporter ATP-binding protein [Anaerolineae bacterium]
MTGKGVLRFDNVSKRFLFTHDQSRSVWDSITARFMRKTEEEFLWAVRGVSFTVEPGQSVGIIGRNGSGKSTLLKLATRILRPTSGDVYVGGRVSALLELGAGFHPDLTGRENVFLNGSVLGLTKQEIIDRFDDIVAFSGLNTFIDMPVKHYSSGMYMRLGFSVAVHCDPDLLLVDEILAVGDQAFQEKCIDHILRLRDSGVTIVIVSHHLKTMQMVCDQLVWMDDGRLQEMGPADETIRRYLTHISRRATQKELAASGPTQPQSNGNDDIEIVGVRFLNGAGKVTDTFYYGEPLTIEIQVVAHRPIRKPEFGIAIHRSDGIHITGSNNRIAGDTIELVSGEGVVRYHIEQLSLLNGVYDLSAEIHDGLRPQAYDSHARAYRFRVISTAIQDPAGLVDLPASWQWEPQNAPIPAQVTK